MISDFFKYLAALEDYAVGSMGKSVTMGKGPKINSESATPFTGSLCVKLEKKIL